MPLFDVAAWSVPEQVAESSKKRMKPSVKPSVNLDKIVKKLRRATSARPNKTQISAPKRLQAKTKSKPVEEHRVPSLHPPLKREIAELEDSDSSESRPRKRMKRDKPQHDTETQRRVRFESHTPAIQTTKNNSSSVLTPLQSGMKAQLEGARFRMINESLYKTGSQDALQMMHEDPKVYEEYHSGFRLQVQSWPTNPVQKYISALSEHPTPGTVIADLGCGDAQLARALSLKGYVVLSFDLLSKDPFVVEADICSHIPLPGSEGTPGVRSEGEGQIVDIAICALSLMATNWPSCIREAWRILKPGGLLKIAEVASRLTESSAFTSLVCSVGFTLTSKDEKNTHFTLFGFKKLPRQWKDQKDWDVILSKGLILKPCEYKRR